MDTSFHCCNNPMGIIIIFVLQIRKLRLREVVACQRSHSSEAELGFKILSGRLKLVTSETSLSLLSLWSFYQTVLPLNFFLTLVHTWLLLQIWPPSPAQPLLSLPILCKMTIANLSTCWFLSTSWPSVFNLKQLSPTFSYIHLHQIWEHDKGRFFLLVHSPSFPESSLTFYEIPPCSPESLSSPVATNYSFGSLGS